MTPASTPSTAFDTARHVADTVLYEGYVLFPYRASATKNRYRWQWGVVVPAEQAAAGATEPHEIHCDVPLRVHSDASVDASMVTVTARFLHLRRRQVLGGDGEPLEQIEVDGTLHVTWDEGIEREVSTGEVTVAGLLEHPHRLRFCFDGSSEVEQLAGGAHLRRTVEPIEGIIEVSAVETAAGAVRLTARVANTTGWSDREAVRDDILLRSLLGTHLLLHVRHGSFASVVDPAPWAETTAAGCHSRHVYPVLIGDHDDDVVLATPIILGDHPQVAPESPGPSFDGLEIDELLALCVQGLSDDEKREARATDARAAEIVDRSDSLAPEALGRLHGAVRPFGPAVTPLPEPEAGVDTDTAAYFGVGEEPIESVTVQGRPVWVGDEVRLRPDRRADVHDLFVDGRLATVERIVRTVDDDTMLAVTLVDDPAAELHRWYGRFQYFHLDEVELHSPPDTRSTS